MSLSKQRQQDILKVKKICRRKIYLKSNKSHTEHLKIDNGNTEIGETKKPFNNLRNKFSREEIKNHRDKFHKKRMGL